MRRRIVLAVLVAALSVVLVATSVLAAPMQVVHIVAPTDLVGGTGAPALFTATGPAVTSGVLCATGTVLTGPISSIGPMGQGSPQGAFSILSMDKLFICDDGSGTFTVELTVKLYITGPKANYTFGSWKVVSGTGSYSGLKSSGGKLVGTPIIPGTSINDVYDGKLK
ncbi:hypothetical protein ACFLR0_00690 [Candidatus Bipolaricaulota bacterium]